jgi:hypothetical protein
MNLHLYSCSYFCMRMRICICICAYICAIYSCDCVVPCTEGSIAESGTVHLTMMDLTYLCMHAHATYKHHITSHF